ncbi:MAG: phytoene/squalene synthase family protein [Kiloniellales bacterium]|nr:phytoene/squalene synthase family protein [Kiloniellales bacterium]
MAAADPLSYCAREVRRHDRDRYLASLLASAERREDLFALYAFNLEVAKTAEVVSEAPLGLIRFQWWRESLDEIYDGRPRRHAVVEPLHRAVTRHGLTRGRFDALIDAREGDLDPDPPADLPELEAYVDATSANLSLLALEILGQSSDAAQEAGRAVGLAWGLLGLLRAVPFHARQKRLYLPRDQIAAQGLALGELFELQSSPALRAIVEGLARRAASHLDRARALRGELPRAAFPALGLATLARRQLALLARSGHDPFDPRLGAESPGDIWRLTFGWLRGVY